MYVHFRSVSYGVPFVVFDDKQCLESATKMGGFSVTCHARILKRLQDSARADTALVRDTIWNISMWN
jgi:hypothetical protein